MGRPGYPAEFRRRVLDLLAEGRSVASVRTISTSATRRSMAGGVKIASTVANRLNSGIWRFRLVVMSDGETVTDVAARLICERPRRSQVNGESPRHHQGDGGGGTRRSRCPKVAASAQFSAL